MFSMIRTFSTKHWLDLLLVSQGLVIIYMMAWLFWYGWLQVHLP
jgi:hypothetical protein